MDKKSISVPEMRRILGLGKTESYWLIKKGYFKTIMLFGKIRVITDSFEEWYANQFHYKKTDGTPPGQNWRHTMSIRETADCSDNGLLSNKQEFVYRADHQRQKAN